MMPVPKLESFEHLQSQLPSPIKSDLEAMVQRAAPITISPVARSKSQSGTNEWSMHFYSGKRKFGQFGAGLTWADALAWCDAFAKVIPNAKVVID